MKKKISLDPACWKAENTKNMNKAYNVLPLKGSVEVILYFIWTILERTLNT